MNITKKIKEQGNQAGVLLADAIDNTVELDLSQYSTGNHIVVLSAPNDSYPDAIIDENVIKKVLAWRTDPNKQYLSVKRLSGGSITNFVFDRRSYYGQDNGTEEIYTCTQIEPELSDPPTEVYLTIARIDLVGSRLGSPDARLIMFGFNLNFLTVAATL